eukprot:CCRYP_006382-RA/>CCRYP_006382-RA protein AED:0.08 eAED:0.08 QI:264/1/1/1/0/0/2/121/724
MILLPLLLTTLLSTTQAQSTSTTLTPVTTSTTVLTTSQTNLLTAQSGGIFTITSDIPVTISRYNDDRYKDGEQPVFPTDASVIVTSDCGDDGSVSPVISWDYSTGGAVSISLNGASSSTSFLSEVASYDASWEWRNWECDIYPTPAPFAFSALSLGPTEAGQVVKITSQAGEQTLNEYQAEQKANGNSGGDADEDESDDPFKEEEYKSTSGAMGVAVWRTVLLGGLLIALLLPGRDGEDLLAHPRFFAVGKVVVAVAALSPLFPKHSRHVLSDNFRVFTSSQAKDATATSHQTYRNLQSNTCTYNVEILIDGCTHPLVINAPAARIVDALVMNSSSQKGNADDLCLYQYSSDITFPLDSSTTTLDMSSGSIEVDALSYSECIRPTDGRPFVDSSGGSLVARPLVRDGCESLGSAPSWTGNANTCIPVDSQPHDIGNHNSTTSTYNPPLPTASLGEEWTQRALGEHASIASFSAFSIALMTNAAPVALVQDALTAGLDEVRHARTSFEIASKLLGREVVPGALPESKHEFGRDLTQLALAVAREGCVDETLSAIAAAMESKELSHAIEHGLHYIEKYAGLDEPTATWIRDELNTIAMEESSHSALAWRTLFWVCRVDSEACNVVNSKVLDESQLELRFNYRFASSFEDKPESLSEMRREWRKVYGALLANVRLDESQLEGDYLLCSEADKRKEMDDGNAILPKLTDNVLRGVLCEASPASPGVRL